MDIHSKPKCVVAMFGTRSRAELAVSSLRREGADLAGLSIACSDVQTEEHAFGVYTSGGAMHFWGGRSVPWGALMQHLASGAFFSLPGFGPLVVMGPLAAALLEVLQGPAPHGAIGALALALGAYGIPLEPASRYQRSVRAGMVLLLAPGAEGQVEHAHALLASAGASQLAAHAG